MKISYSQCWEDPRVLCEALQITDDDDIVSIASGGDNTFALLLQNPRSITAVDWSAAQIHLVELKMRAIQVLDYEDFAAFIGVASADNRLNLYRNVRGVLTDSARQYWDSQEENLKMGVIHAGKFEKYFSKFRRLILPLVHSKATCDEFLSLPALEDQRNFYKKIWNNRRWRLMFRAFFGKFILGHFGRDPGHFRYVTLENIAAELLERTERGLTEVPVSDNFFVEYILRGNYRDLQTVHPYLAENNFHFLKSHIGKINLVCGSLEGLLKQKPPDSYSKFNLSNIFEYMSDNEYEQALRAIIRVSRDGSKLAFWTLFVPRSEPPLLTDSMKICSSTSEKLSALDRTFFYSGFHLADFRNTGFNSFSDAGCGKSLNVVPPERTAFQQVRSQA